MRVKKSVYTVQTYLLHTHARSVTSKELILYKHGITNKGMPVYYRCNIQSYVNETIILFVCLINQQSQTLSI